MEGLGISIAAIVLINILLSYKGFKNSTFLDKYSFRVDDILSKKEYYRLISSGFLHVSWSHLIFNMMSLYFFSIGLESMIGTIPFLLLYFGSLIGGNLFALFIHRNHGDYNAVGASGAVSGVIFACIAIFPGIGISLLFIPISIPGWLYRLVYVSVTIYGIKSQKDNIGHEAHLGGGILGLLIAILISPNSLFSNSLPIILILAPTIVFLYIILKQPHLLLVKKPFGKVKGPETFEDKYNSQRAQKQDDIDKILDKINRKGNKTLSKRDRKKLDDLSK